MQKWKLHFLIHFSPFSRHPVVTALDFTDKSTSVMQKHHWTALGLREDKKKEQVGGAPQQRLDSGGQPWGYGGTGVLCVRPRALLVDWRLETAEELWQSKWEMQVPWGSGTHNTFLGTFCVWLLSCVIAPPTDQLFRIAPFLKPEKLSFTVVKYINNLIDHSWEIEILKISLCVYVCESACACMHICLCVHVCVHALVYLSTGVPWHTCGCRFSPPTLFETGYQAAFTGIPGLQASRDFLASISHLTVNALELD